MRATDRCLVIAVVAAVTSVPVFGLSAQVPTAPADGFILSTPSCSTHDTTGAPATSFAARDEMTVRGTSFPSETLVLLTFSQGSVSAELGRFRTNAAGEFTTEPRQVRLPSGTSAGPATVHVASEGPSASCLVQMAAPLPARTARPEADVEGDDPNVVFAIWATVLALGGGFLTFVSYRWWQERRLAKKMSEGGRRRSRRGRREAGPPPLENVVAPPPAGYSYADPPRLPVGWDDGREPSPMREPHRE